MANVLNTVQQIARQALPILIENLLMPNLAYKDFSADFVGKGDTINIEVPPVFEGKDFDIQIEVQDAQFGKIPVVMDKLADVSVQVTSKELALGEPQFVEKVTRPMAMALAEKINREGFDLYKDIPYFIGESGKTPSVLADISNIRKELNKNKAPLSNRSAIWDVEADAKFLELSAIVNAEKSGTIAALREGSLGRIFGMDNYYSQAVSVHEAGGYTILDDVKMTGTKNSETVTLTSAAKENSGYLKKGDLLIVEGDCYAVKEDAVANSGVIAVKVYPKLKENVTDKAVTFPDKTAGGHTANIAFNKYAFAFVTRSLELPSDVEAYVTSYNGITLRIVKSYDISKKTNILSMDVLYGWKTLCPELAVITLG